MSKAHKNAKISQEPGAITYHDELEKVEITVGRSVHFLMAVAAVKTVEKKKNEHDREITVETKTPRPPEACTATVTKVNPDGTVNLCVFNDEKCVFYWPKAVKFSEQPKEGHWNWPPR